MSRHRRTAAHEAWTVSRFFEPKMVMFPREEEQIKKKKEEILSALKTWNRKGKDCARRSPCPPPPSPKTLDAARAYSLQLSRWLLCLSAQGGSSLTAGSLTELTCFPPPRSHINLYRHPDPEMVRGRGIGRYQRTGTGTGTGTGGGAGLTPGS